MEKVALGKRNQKLHPISEVERCGQSVQISLGKSIIRVTVS